ncbi:MAG: hypothetical protein MUF51_00780 [Vicinamibacteria bacterium]|jgi:hypothetical protein|nr:hypothetical protein [Vicinamibacteria bacterium]
MSRTPCASSTGGGRPIQVSKVEVSFFDAKNKQLSSETIECEKDCSVAAKATETFGPIDGPSGWDHAEVGNVFYEVAEDSAPAEATRLTCVEFCRKMNSVAGCASPEDAAYCPVNCQSLEKPAACKAKLDAALACAAQTTFTCNGSKVNLGACDKLQSAFMECFLAQP